VYWAALTLLLGAGIASGSVSGVQVFFPCVLVVFYAVRGYQIFKGDPAAARRIVWLHAVGGVAAILQMSSRHGLVVALNGVKIAIHVFGAITAYLAQRSPRS
jgi:hypothetical protein